MGKTLLMLTVLVAPVWLFAQEIHPFEFKQQYEQAFILAKNGKPEKALELLSDLKQKTDKQDSIHLFAVMLSVELNNANDHFVAAIKDCEELIKLKPETEVDCQQIIGRQKQYLGDFDGAVAAFKRIIQLKPVDKIVYSNLASTYSYAGKYEEAIRALNANPNKVRMPKEDYYYALAYYKLNKIDSAQLHIDKYLATEEGDNSQTGFMYGALIYDALKDKATACNYITAANDILEEKDVEAKAEKSSPEMKETILFRKSQEETNTIKELKPKLCRK